MTLFYFLRSVLFAIGQISTMVMFSLVGQLTRPFSKKTRYAFMSQWAVFCLWWLRLTCGVKYQVTGRENIDPKTPSLILSRHESTWETLVLQVLFPRQAFVLKQELLKIPFFGWGMKLLNPIAIDRSAGRKALNQMLEEGQQRLASGDWVVVFPEGTRVAPDEAGKINIGGSMLAAKAKVPVYLVAHNAGKYWPKNAFIKKPGTVDIRISEPLDMNALSVKELNQKIETWFAQTR